MNMHKNCVFEPRLTLFDFVPHWETAEEDVRRKMVSHFTADAGHLGIFLHVPPHDSQVRQKSFFLVQKQDDAYAVIECGATENVEFGRTTHEQKWEEGAYAQRIYRTCDIHDAAAHLVRRMKAVSAHD